MTGRKKVKRQTGWVDRLWYAVEFNDVRTVERLLAQGADVNHAFRQVRTEQGHRRHRQTALFIAVRKNYTRLVEVLLGAGSRVNQLDDRGESALFVAVCRGHAKLACRLLEAGTDANNQNRQGDTPAHIAVTQGHLAILDYLIKAGCDLSLTNDGCCTPLMLAVLLHADAHDGRIRTRRRQRHGQAGLIQCLAVHDPNVNATNPLGETALHLAVDVGGVSCGDYSVAACLVQHGARPDLPNVVGESPLYLAACTSRRSPAYISPNFLRLLVAAGAHLCSEMWLAEAEGTPGVHADILGELRQLARTPRTLASICKLVIREALRARLWAKVDCLPIPATIKDCLKFTDVDVDDVYQVR